MVLPAGTTLPPPAYAAVVLVALAGVVWALRRAAPAVDGRTVVAFAPWMAVGSALYVTYQVDLVPRAAAPLVGSPTVYATTFVLAGGVWLLADRRGWPVPLTLAAVGSGALLVVAGAVLLDGLARGTFHPLPSLVALVVASVVAGVAWWAVGRLRPRVVAVTGGPGALAVFGHAVDGVSTAVGVDVLHYGEQTPLSRAVMDVAASLPTASTLGVGWLFVAVKLALALVVVGLMCGYARDDATEAALILGVVAAVGLGPGVHNLLLFAVTTP